MKIIIIINNNNVIIGSLNNSVLKFAYPSVFITLLNIDVIFGIEKNIKKKIKIVNIIILKKHILSHCLE